MCILKTWISVIFVLGTLGLQNVKATQVNNVILDSMRQYEALERSDVNEAKCYITNASVTVVQSWKDSAENGFSEGQFLYAKKCYFSGKAEDYAKWIRKALEQGLPAAEYEMGHQMRFAGVLKSQEIPGNIYEGAIPWWKKAAEKGYTPAQVQLANCYQFGLGVGTNLMIAEAWLSKAVMLGFLEGQQRLGLLQYEIGLTYIHGKYDTSSLATNLLSKPVVIIEKNQLLAFEFFKKAVASGHIEATKDLALCYKNGWGTATNSTKAFALLQEVGNSDLQMPTDKANLDNKELSEVFYYLAELYSNGEGTEKDVKKAFCYYHKAATNGNFAAALRLGIQYETGNGVEPNREMATFWFEKKIELQRTDLGIGFPSDYSLIGALYYFGIAEVKKDTLEAIKWYKKAAMTGDKQSLILLGNIYEEGDGVLPNYIGAYAWYCIALGRGEKYASRDRERIERKMTPTMIQEGQALAERISKEIEVAKKGKKSSPVNIALTSAGTGFFVTANGYLITAAHVVSKMALVKVAVGENTKDAKVVSIDEKNDVALLKIEGNNYTLLPLGLSKDAKLGQDVFTIGFPNMELQGKSPKLTKGTISALKGMRDDPSCFQISVSVQPGNSGGPLVDSNGLVIGIINARLNDVATVQLTGSLPQNVNYAVKAAYVLPLLESIGDESVPSASTISMTFEKAAKLAEQAVCIVLGYE